MFTDNDPGNVEHAKTAGSVSSATANAPADQERLVGIGNCSCVKVDKFDAFGSRPALPQR
jgi:hypothetical protein